MHANALVQLQDLLQRLSAAQQLVQRVLELEAQGQQAAASIASLQHQLACSQAQAQQLQALLAAWQARGSGAEARVQQQAEQLAVSTPRPARDLGLLVDLLPQEVKLLEQALVAGACSLHLTYICACCTCMPQAYARDCMLSACVPSPPPLLACCLQACQLSSCTGCCWACHLMAWTCGPGCSWRAAASTHCAPRQVRAAGGSRCISCQLQQ